MKNIIIRNVEKKNYDEYLVRFINGNIAIWGKEFIKNKMRTEENLNNYSEMLTAFNS